MVTRQLSHGMNWASSPSSFTTSNALHVSSRPIVTMTARVKPKRKPRNVRMNSTIENTEKLHNMWRWDGGGEEGQDKEFRACAK